MSNLTDVAKTFKHVREIVFAIAAIGGFIVAGVLGWQTLQDKPTRAEVDMKIAEGTEERAEMRADLQALASKMSRVVDVQKYQIAQSDWQSDVLEHLAYGRRGKPPVKPENLRQLKAGLLSIQ